MDVLAFNAKQVAEEFLLNAFSDVLYHGLLNRNEPGIGAFDHRVEIQCIVFRPPPMTAPGLQAGV